jgi:DNA-binding transcriptional regulator YiaG
LGCSQLKESAKILGGLQAHDEVLQLLALILADNIAAVRREFHGDFFFGHGIAWIALGDAGGVRLAAVGRDGHTAGLELGKERVDRTKDQSFDIRDSRMSAAARTREETCKVNIECLHLRRILATLCDIRDSRMSSKLVYRDEMSCRLRTRTKSRSASPDALGDRLYAWRRKNDLSQGEAALKLRLSMRTLQEWEQGRAQPRGFALSAINERIGS